MSDLSPQNHIDLLEEVLEILDGKGHAMRKASVRYAIGLIKQQLTNIEAYYVCHQRVGKDCHEDVYNVSKEDFDKLYPFKEELDSTYGDIPEDIQELASECCDEALDLTQAQIDLIPDNHWILVTDY